MHGINDTDIDIDIANRDDLLRVVPHVDASMINDNIIKKHNVGVYFQDAPTFMNTGMCSIDYKSTGQYGFFKVDVLNNSVYDDIESETQLNELLSMDVDWDMLQFQDVVSQLPHIANHHELVLIMKPKSVKDLADVLAMMRPAKKNLLDDYMRDKDNTRRILYVKPSDGQFYFKYSHAIAYAVSITVRMNYLKYVERINYR